MNGPELLLAVPSGFVLAGMVFHSLRSLGRSRAITFWVAVTSYAVARGIGVRLVTERGLHASIPYVLRDAGPSILGVAAQEIAGWAVVAYLGWWVGCRFARSVARSGPRLFVAVTWACVFLAAASWAVETAAAAAGWWHWTIPASHAVLGPVPAIGIVNWSLVGVDFLLPLVAWTAPALRGSVLRYACLAAFPVHFAAHLVPDNGESVFSVFAAVHGGLILALLALAVFCRVEDDAFEFENRRIEWLPAAAIGVIVAVSTAAIAWFGGEPGALLAVLPLVASAVAAGSAWPHAVVVLGAVGFGTIDRAFLVTAALSTAAVGLRGATRGGSLRAGTLVALAALAMAGARAQALRDDARLRAGLDDAIEARDRGDIASAVAQLEFLTGAGPRSHVPFALLGEIRYRTGNLEAARAAFEQLIAIQPTYTSGHRYLSVIGLRRGLPRIALDHARRGLVMQPDDVELGYLQQRAGGSTGPGFWERVLHDGPRAVAAVASIAFEVDDRLTAEHAVASGLARWPDDALLLDKWRRLGP